MNAHAQTVDAPAGLPETFVKLLSRLVEVLERENADLRNNDLSMFPEYVRQKDLLLLDLSRLFRMHGDSPQLRALLDDELRRVKETLAENARLLELHLGAAREFASFLEDSIRRHRSDGTYSRNVARGGYGKW